MSATEIPTYPARPVNGGALESALPMYGSWAWQPKIDDWRVLIHVPTLRVWNREGEPSATRQKIKPALEKLPPVFDWLDAGVIGLRTKIARNSIVVFDCIPTANEASTEYRWRRNWLENVFTEVLPWSTEMAGCEIRDAVFLIPQFAVCDEQGAFRSARLFGLWKDLKVENASVGSLRLYEGLVAKRVDKPYPIQLRSPRVATPWMVKHRFLP